MSKNSLGWLALSFLACAGCRDASDAGGPAGTGGTGGGAAGSGGTQQSGGTGGMGGSATIGSGGAGGDAGSSGGGAGGERACPEPGLTTRDLFSCDAPLSCPAVCIHNTFYGDCGGDTSCGQELYANEEPGTLLIEARPGPGNAQSDTLTLLLSDGGAIVQTRYRYCEEFPCDFDAIPWTVYRQELCDVIGYRPCGSGDCDPYPATVNCAPLLTELSCADLERALEGEFDHDLDEGEACEEEEDAYDCTGPTVVRLVSDAWQPGFYSVDLTQANARLLCDLELTELRSARDPESQSGEGGAAGAKGAASRELYASGFGCSILENNGGVDNAPRIRFNEGLEVRMAEPGPVDIRLLHENDEVLAAHVEPPDDCSMPVLLEVPEL